VSALLALASSAGGFGAVLRRGDADQGALLLVIAERGSALCLLERTLQGNGTYAWTRREIGDSADLAQYVAKAAGRDPDLWVVELDVPSPERFIAEISSAT
jgi:hypothetical protein